MLTPICGSQAPLWPCPAACQHPELRGDRGGHRSQALGPASPRGGLRGYIPSVANFWELAQPGFYVSFCVSHVRSHRFAAGHDRQLASSSISDAIAASTGHKRRGQPAPGVASIGDIPQHRTFGSCTARILRIVCSGRVCSHRFAVSHDRQLASTPNSDAIAASTGLRRRGQPAPGAASEGDIPSASNLWMPARLEFYVSSLKQPWALSFCLAASQAHLHSAGFTSALCSQL